MIDPTKSNVSFQTQIADLEKKESKIFRKLHKLSGKQLYQRMKLPLSCAM